MGRLQAGRGTHTGVQRVHRPEWAVEMLAREGGELQKPVLCLLASLEEKSAGCPLASLLYFSLAIPL